MEHSGIPEPRRVNNFQSFKQLPGTKESYEAALFLANGDAEHRLLLIYGMPGNGKTHLAYASGLLAVERGLSVIFKSCAGWFAEMRRAMQATHIKSPDEIMDEMKRVDFLVLDDLGVNYGTDWEGARLDELIDSRYAEERYLLATTNLNIAQLPARIKSRFLDTELGKVVLNEGADYRRERGRVK